VKFRLNAKHILTRSKPKATPPLSRTGGLRSVSQATVSGIENAEDHLVSTLVATIEAMGGHLKIVAEFETESVALT